MSVINLNRMKLTKNLKKILPSQEKSIENTSIDKNNLNATNNSNSFRFLPPLKKSAKKMAYLKSNSVLTKFINQHTKDIINSTEKDLSRPIKITNYKTKLINRENQKLKKYVKSLEKNKNENFNNNTHKENSSGKINRINQTNNTSSLKFLLTSTYNSNKNISLNSKKEKAQNDNIITDINNINDSEKRDNFLNLSTLSIESNLENIEYKKLLKSKFHRLRNYQPILEENWKFKNGLTDNIIERKDNSYLNNIEYQSNVFSDQYNLFFGEFQYYVFSIYSNENYLKSFQSLSLKQKIKYNKTLEETIGILYILPQILLAEFYIGLFKNLKYSHIPDENKYKKKYIFDEIKCLKYNNELLFETFIFFQTAFKCYKELSQNVKDLYLNGNNYSKLISFFEKIRYNMSYITNASENSLKNLEKDLKMINKLNNFNSFYMVKTKKDNNSLEQTKEEFKYRSSKEKRKNLRINKSLGFKYNDIEDDEFYGKHPYAFNKKTMKSIVNSKLVSKLIKHCKDDFKNAVKTERIIKDIEGDLGDEFYLNNLRKRVTKLNI